jgi:hypothetical protein
MKTINPFLILLFLTFCVLPAFSNEMPRNLPTSDHYLSTAYVSSESNPSEEEVALELSARLADINAMDKSGMTRKEKRSLRSEVKSIEAKLNAGSGGVYLSVGALLLVIIILIVLL